MSLFALFRGPMRREYKLDHRRNPTLHLEALEDRALPSAALPLAIGAPATASAAVDQAPTITFVNGSGQSIYIGFSFQPLQARVMENGQGISGVPVTFTAPTDGASGFFGLFARSVTVLTDANGWATAPVFTANGSVGAYTVTTSSSSASGMGTFTLSNIPTPMPLAPSGFPNLVAWQMTFDYQAFPSFNTPQGECSLANQLGTWFALSYLQSPQQATQMLWAEIGLMQQFLWERGSNVLLERNEQALDLSMSLIVNPLYNTPVGYGTALLESELILVSVL